jgi:hypothetical protein
VVGTAMSREFKRFCAFVSSRRDRGRGKNLGIHAPKRGRHIQDVVSRAVRCFSPRFNLLKSLLLNEIRFFIMQFML